MGTPEQLVRLGCGERAGQAASRSPQSYQRAVPTGFLGDARLRPRPGAPGSPRLGTRAGWGAIRVTPARVAESSRLSMRPRAISTSELDKFIESEFHKWSKTFPDEFNEQMFKLKGWTYIPFRKARSG